MVDCRRHLLRKLFTALDLFRREVVRLVERDERDTQPPCA